MDKRAARQLLDLVRARVTSNIDQWQLCAILCIALKNLPQKIWVNSFKKVNLHPDHRVPFKEWIQRIDSHIATGNKVYTRTNKDCIYDTMPGFWKAMKFEEMQKVLQHINSLTNEVGEKLWAEKTHLLSLSEFVPLQQVPKLRIFHQSAKVHPDVIVGTRIETIIINDKNGDTVAPYNYDSDADANLVKTPTNASSSHKQIVQTNANHQLNSYMLLPPTFLKAIKEEKQNLEKVSAREKLFAHTVQFCNRTNYARQNVCVSAYLNAEVSKDQRHLLNPTVLDTVAGFILKDSQGEGGKKRLPQCCLNLVDGQISSQCSVLNSEERMKLVRLYNEVAAVMVDIYNDRNKEREKNCVRKDQEEAEKE